VPFEGYGGFSFTPVSVSRNAPPTSGVYGLSNASEWIYVGVADNLQAALMGHLREIGTLLKSRGPKGFTFEICHPSQCSARQMRLVTELSPVCNKNGAP
jgi:hypothetical protein